MKVKVVNERGDVQNSRVQRTELKSDGELYPMGYNHQTGGDGTVTLDVDPGDSLQASRDPYTTGACASPEGATGRSYTVPATVPATATIVLPSINLPSSNPGLDQNERYFVGLVNQERERRGLAKLAISTTLSAVNDGYATHLANNNFSLYSPDGHCQASSWSVRAFDVGLPLRYIGEVISGSAHRYYAPEDAFKSFMNSPPHADILMRSNRRFIGVGQFDGFYVGTVIDDCSTVGVGSERCGMTSDFGTLDAPEQPSASAPTGGRSSGGSGGGSSAGGSTTTTTTTYGDSGASVGAGEQADLQFANLRTSGRLAVRRRALTFNVGTTSTVARTGQFSVSARSAAGKTVRGRSIKTSGELRTFRVRFPRAGKWKLTVRFQAAGWETQKLVRSLRVR